MFLKIILLNSYKLLQDYNMFKLNKKKNEMKLLLFKKNI